MMELVGKNAGIVIDKEIAWHGLYLEILPKIFRYFAYRCGDMQAAEDLAATTFERAWSKRSRFKNNLGRFEAWVFGIARKVAGEYFRKANRESTLEAIHIGSDQTDIAETLDRNDDFERLRRLLSKLKDQDRDLLSLKYGGGRTNREISSLTGLSESNVGTRLHRLITSLRGEWE